MRTTTRAAKLVQNAHGGWYIETRRAVILKRAKRPVSSFGSEQQASDAARRLGLLVRRKA